MQATWAEAKTRVDVEAVRVGIQTAMEMETGKQVGEVEIQPAMEMEVGVDEAKAAVALEI